MVPNPRRQQSSHPIVADQIDSPERLLTAGEAAKSLGGINPHHAVHTKQGEDSKRVRVPPSQHVQQPEWLDIKALTLYACVSERTIREWIHLPVNPLPAFQVGRKLLFRRSTFDHWLEAHPFKSADAVNVSSIVDDVLIEFRKAS